MKKHYNYNISDGMSKKIRELSDALNFKLDYLFNRTVGYMPDLWLYYLH